MHLAAHDIPQLMDEYHALIRHYGQTQARCDALVREQAAEIARLQGQAMRLRAALIVRDTALAWERAQRLDAPPAGPHAGVCTEGDAAAAERPGLEASAAAADLVICQTGCLSHGDYWRVQDHCRRTGKTCVLVESSAAARIVGFSLPAPTDRVAGGMLAPEETGP